MKQAKDLMTPAPLHVPTDSDLKQVVQFYLDHNISSCPVINSEGQVMGVLTELDLIKAFLLHHLIADEHDNVSHHKEILSEPHFVREDAGLPEVVKEMLKAPSHRLLVLNDNDKLSGIISPKDILSFLAGERIQTSSLRDNLDKAQKEIQTLKEELNDVKSVLSQYKNLYEDSPTMMHSVDPEGKIIMANRRLHEALNYAPGEMIGMTMYQLYPEAAHLEAQRGLERIMHEGHHQTTYTVMVKKTGEKIRVDLASRALFDENGQFIATVTASRIIDSEHLLKALHSAFNESGREIRDDNDLVQSLAELQKKLGKGVKSG